jgi:hypothetical protein
MDEDTRPCLTVEQARQKRDECLEWTKVANRPSHQLLLKHMAGMWDRIARDLEGEAIRRIM